MTVLEVATRVGIAVATISILNQQPLVRLSLRAPTQLTIHEPVLLNVQLQNDSAAEIQANLGYDRIGQFQFDVVDPKGVRHSHQPRVFDRGDGPSRPDLVKIQPGTTYSDRILLNEWFQFETVGVYQLTVRFNGSISGPTVAGDQIPRLRSSSVRIDARDEVKLRATCARLADEARHCCSSDAENAGRALACIVDPVAIPALAECLEAEVSPRFFESLVKIGGPASRQALERLSQHRTPWVAKGATEALSRIK